MTRDIYLGLEIFLRYNESDECEGQHDDILAGLDVHPTPEDRQRLADLGWEWDAENTCWRHGT
jgi:hypothetical protein